MVIFTTIPSLRLLVPYLFLLSALVAADPVHMTLSRRENASRRTPGAVAEAIRRKYGFTSPRSEQRLLSRAGRQADIPLINQLGDRDYFVSLTIGTPPQTFNVSLDTGSADLLVGGTACLDPLTNSDSCGIINLYNSSASNTSSYPNISRGLIDLTYGSGVARAIVVADTVSMAGFTVNVPFLSASEMDSGLSMVPTSGLMGLAFQNLSFIGQRPFWESLMSQNQLSSPEFSFMLSRSNSIRDVAGGDFTLGGVNKALYSGEIEYHDVITHRGQLDYWSIALTGLTVQGKNVTLGNATHTAIVDTGTTLIGGPTAAVEAFYASIGTLEPSNYTCGYYIVGCNIMPNVTLSFGGRAWPIASADMIAGEDEDGQCIGAIFALDPPCSKVQPQPFWVVGDTFLKNVYTVFRGRPASVGFARLSAAAA